MNYEFLHDADEEFREAFRYYENEAPGVGLAFIAEVHRVISVVIVQTFRRAGLNNTSIHPSRWF